MQEICLPGSEGGAKLSFVPTPIVVGTPKSQSRQFEKELLDSEHWSQVVPGVEVKMVAHPDGAGIEQFILCCSKSRREKNEFTTLASSFR